jgi:hypothetical protein
MRRTNTNSQLKWALGIGLATFFLLGAAAAYAYWTANGSGSGTAPVGTTTDNLSIASPSVTGIGPGASAPVAVTVTNPNGYSVRVDTVSTVITTSDPGCLPADFTFPAKVLNTTIAPLGTVSFTQDLVFADTVASQDPCKGATITLTYSSN